MRGIVGWAGAALAALALAACAPERGGALPAPSATSSGRAASASATPRPLTTAEIESQALATVRGYYAALDHAVATGAVDDVLEMTTERCSCRRLLGNIAQIWRDGSIRGDAFFVVRSTILHDGAASSAAVYAIFDGQPYDILDNSGTVIRQIRAAPGKREEIDLTRKGELWLVDDVRALN